MIKSLLSFMLLAAGFASASAMDNSAPVYQLLDITTGLIPDGSESVALDVNDNLQAVGQYEESFRNWVTFFYDDGAVTIIARGSDRMDPELHIDAVGRVYGSLPVEVGSGTGTIRSRPYVFENGQRRDLLDFPPGSPQAETSYFIDDVSANGVVLGHSLDVNGNEGTFIYEDGQVRFPTLGKVLAWGGINDQAEFTVQQNVRGCKTTVIYDANGRTVLSEVTNLCGNEPGEINNQGVATANAFDGSTPFDRFSAGLYSDG